MLRATFRRLRPPFLPTIEIPAFPSYTADQIQRVETGSRFDYAWQMNFLLKKKSSNGGDEPISPWHNIPLTVSSSSNAATARVGATTSNNDDGSKKRITISPKTVFNYVNEIPRGSREKIECAPQRANNPLLQDRNKDGSLRKFTYDDIPFHYGFLPRTFEDPEVKDSRTGKLGDGDPVDVVFLTAEDVSIGEIRHIRIVGAFAMIDGGETDWKMLAVPAENTNVKNINDVPDQLLFGVHRWFKMYKTTDGKPENEFAFEGKPVDADFAIEVVADTSKQYLDVACGKTKKGKNAKIWTP